LAFVHVELRTSPFPQQEALLARLYRILISKCTFDQFDQAYIENTIPQLARKQGMELHCQGLRQLEIHPGTPPLIMTSCYLLKGFIFMDAVGKIKPPSLVVSDYGYGACRNLTDKIERWSTYRRLSMNPEHYGVYLQLSCEVGDIYGHVKRVLPDVPESFARLCKKCCSYPLSGLVYS